MKPIALEQHFLAPETGVFVDQLPRDEGVIADRSCNNAAGLLRIGAPS